MMVNFYLLVLLVTMVMVMLSIAFYTLLERKVLGVSQIRLAPNKASLVGIVQPILDGIKLLSKLGGSPTVKMSFIFYLAPLLSLIVMFMVWSVLMQSPFMLSFQYSLLFMIMSVGLSIYVILFAGWSSSSKFGSIGSIRASSQSISYEISLILIIIQPMVVVNSMMMSLVSDYYMGFLLPLFVMWLISCVAECNRAPFDFSEGESELISGFNIEYSSSGFTLLFLAEYGSILAFSMISTMLFMSNSLIGFIGVFFVFLYLRSSMPRYRYDKLMSLCWTKLLPVSVMSLVLMMIFT